MSYNDFIYLFQFLYGQLAIGLIIVLVILLVWDIAVTYYRQYKEDSREIVTDGANVLVKEIEHVQES